MPLLPPHKFVSETHTYSTKVIKLMRRSIKYYLSDEWWKFVMSVIKRQHEFWKFFQLCYNKVRALFVPKNNVAEVSILKQKITSSFKNLKNTDRALWRCVTNCVAFFWWTFSGLLGLRMGSFSGFISANSENNKKLNIFPVKMFKYSMDAFSNNRRGTQIRKLLIF